MKKYLILLFLVGIMLPVSAKQEGGPALQMVSGGTSGNAKSQKIYSSSGSFLGTVKPIGNNQFVEYNRYGQRASKIKVNSDGSIRVYKRAGH